jgi:hypothetical protein
MVDAVEGHGQGALMQKKLAVFILPAVLAVFAAAPAFAQVRIGAHVGDVGIRIGHDAPPRPRVEVRTARPGRNHQWIGGYWERQNDQWAWSGGRWEEPRERGSRWIKPKYHREHDGSTRYEEGRWSSRH